LSKVRPDRYLQVADDGGTPHARASLENKRAESREPVAFTTRRANGVSGFRNGEQTTW
jgi:hypothetical protein